MSEANLREQWISALRSGKYQQGQLRLRTMSDKFCCLGVLCDIVNPHGWKKMPPDDQWYFLHADNHCSSMPPDEILTMAGSNEEERDDLVSMNDSKGKSFSQIADYLEGKGRGLKERWVAALRSGKYQQSKKALRPVEGGYCCLGVLCDLIDPEGWGEEQLVFGLRSIVWRYDGSEVLVQLSRPLMREIGLSPEQHCTLIDLNDNGASFEEIADWIEANL